MARAVHHRLVGAVALRAFLAFLLTSALFVAPSVAAHQDFAHAHPEDTPHHVHSVSGMLGVTVVTAPLELVVVAAVVFTLAAPLPGPVSAVRVEGALNIRAPPEAIL